MGWISNDWLPWLDRAGRVSRLRAAVFALLWVPLALLAARTLAGDLGPRPITEAIHDSGDWTVRLLILTIVVTPLRQVSGRSELIGVRRMIGVATLVAALLHVTLYMADLGWDAGRIATEILIRPYLAIGFVALAGLVALGVTSTDGAIRRLGGAAWKRLHGLVHPIVLLALVHVFLQSKLDLAQGAILTGVACAGLAIRLAAERGSATSIVAAIVAAAVASIGGGAMEAVWFTLKTGRSPTGLLASNFDAAYRIPPSWIAGAIAATALVVAHLVRRKMPARRVR
ncbi:sulfoxide reductase heme-binding subunit YedZ [Siculibacillus lacustris]|uniref:Protein-methionine-sulfoxide reductase heme-binding subunit MsrQ n=1 Tax=Siculibacillus lacustris TaxID=1549641 RepID=A0A4Q9VHL6_9HYPH|nr:ferric reductase-like transmembrane domain-containing protein [Siculibacillus lacustris]TBW34637.1 sulfoxide reductase heme-binding subunit YedZ [Siculibacillus lacustris]